MVRASSRALRCAAIAFSLGLMLVVAQPGYAQPACYQHPPKILVLRGVFEIFSLGMNDLARKLVCHGYDATVTSWSLALLEADCDDPRPLVVIGHSLGGRMCGWSSRKFKGCGRRVPLIILVDANLLQSIPSNVDKCLNLYVTNKFGIFHGSPVYAESPSTQIVNWDISRGQPSMFEGGVNHFDIDSTDWVHDIIIRELDATFRQAPYVPHARTSRSKAKLDQPKISTAGGPRRDQTKSPVVTMSSPRQKKSSAHEPSMRVRLPSRPQVVSIEDFRDRRVAWQPTRRPQVARDQQWAVEPRQQPVTKTPRSTEKVAWRPTRRPRIAATPRQSVQ